MEAGCSGRRRCRSHKLRNGFFSRFLCYTRNSSGDEDRISPKKSLSSTSSSSVSLRSYDRGGSEERQPHFLEACFLCKEPLRWNTDIFMYRGDTPFCSEECRYKQIVIDEVNEKRLKLSATPKALRTGTAVAA
ncbi:poly(U)-specific endoribonuclease-B-like [Hibiscus syriacus]|uniref:Poly(U)-specific endoribonuclease-B-like n=1 Tax=Hibiscus syriacus TaxID=106335 RepID=A0A6A2Y375_HIBSY|nr:FCS-Like Zinc finger 3-like [Hibiscus syriacus]KAE8662654.1 poly(U)-specific endoribonuclease-B-like [Hibiscus syriacus]